MARRYAYISSVNDKGRTVLKGPYYPGQDAIMEEDRDKLNRPSNVVYLPTRNIHSASSVVRNDISNEEDIDKASCTRFKYKER